MYVQFVYICIEKGRNVFVGGYMGYFQEGKEWRNVINLQSQK